LHTRTHHTNDDGGKKMISRLVVDMDDDLKRKFRIKAFEKRLTMKDIIIKAIENYVRAAK